MPFSHNYYARRFIKDFGIIASRLKQLLRKDAFNWTVEAMTSFNTLKQALSTAPVLHLLDYQKPFMVDCDACFGAVLHQGAHYVKNWLW
jgi:hypothetical protein